MGWTTRFFLAVLLISSAEFYLLMWVSEHTSWLVAIALCVLTGVIGGSLVRYQGIQTLFSVQQQMGQGKVPSVEIISGLILLIIGTFLLTPGFLTDSFAFLLLIPVLREQVSRKILSMFTSRTAAKMSRQYTPHSTIQDDTIIDVAEDDVHVDEGL